MLLPLAPAHIVPYITAYAEEGLLPAPLTYRLGRPGVAYEDETPYDRDGFGALWVRPQLRPEHRLRTPRLQEIHPYRQRRVMLNGLCQVCTRPAADRDGATLYLMRHTGGPITSGEQTSSPPVCVPCAALSVQLCGALQQRRWVAAWVGSAPAWGVAGLVHDPATLRPLPGRALEMVSYHSPAVAWTTASRTVVELHDVEPADLEAEWEAFGAERLEEEFARVAGRRATQEARPPRR
ncbi:hypothetical protein ACFWC2_14750 [Streptomyces diastaticus]|uniref:hypothetical protein n=1 Tax=Streptomyces diastaticus TaxID=1956 RepID=UPI00365CC68C